jgi:hypothetical protein
MPFDPRVVAAIAAADESSGLAKRYPGFMTRMAQIESGGNPDAYNASGAAGLYQFVPSTARGYGLANPYDPAASAQAASRLTLDNAAALSRALGREPTQGELYLAHQQGASGASKLLANPDARAADVVGAKAVTSNGGSADDTAAAFAQRWLGKFDSAGPAMTMPASAGGTAGAGAFGLSGPVSAGAASSVTPAAGATMQAPAEAERGPDVAAILKALTSTGAATATAAPQAAAAPAPMPLQPVQRRAQPFDAAAYLASLQRTARS